MMPQFQLVIVAGREKIIFYYLRFPYNFVSIWHYHAIVFHTVKFDHLSEIVTRSALVEPRACQGRERRRLGSGLVLRCSLTQWRIQRGRSSPPPQKKIDYMYVFLKISFCIRMLKNKAQIARESREFWIRARNVRACVRIIFCAPSK